MYEEVSAFVPGLVYAQCCQVAVSDCGELLSGKHVSVLFQLTATGTGDEDLNTALRNIDIKTQPPASAPAQCVCAFYAFIALCIILSHRNMLKLSRTLFVTIL